MVFSAKTNHKYRRYVNQSEELKQTLANFIKLKTFLSQIRDYGLLVKLVNITVDVDKKLLVINNQRLFYRRNIDEYFLEQIRGVYSKAVTALLGLLNEYNRNFNNGAHANNRYNSNGYNSHNPNAYDDYNQDYYY